jgi:hypothetical protein
MKYLKTRVFKFACLVLASVVAAINVGCGGGGGGGQNPPTDTTPPTITNTNVTSPLDFNGGTVTISARVTDAGGVAAVTALIIKPDTKTEVVQMIGSTNYAGTFNAPANLGSSAAVYRVIISATDTSGNSASAPEIQFTVSPPDVPPPPPPPPAD